ncbi:MAG TPA: GNAT family N-acetyltransferase [Gaiellales bacterium]
MRVVPAAELGTAKLLEVFNAGFSDYLVPLRLDEATLRTHLHDNDIALDRSPVALAEEPAAFALLGVRGQDGWIGGMATVPAQRRQGLARGMLDAAIESAREAGCSTVWLEVVDRNTAAVALYRARGFAQVRDLTVWSLPAAERAGEALRKVDELEAQAWIAAHREEREPWQRADGTLSRLRETGAALRGLVLERSGEVAGAIVYRDATTVSVFQLAAADDEAAAALLCAAANGRDLHVTNAPVDGRVSRVLAGRGATAIAGQHEMRLDLSS